MKTKQENPDGLHQRYVVKKIKRIRNPKFEFNFSETLYGKRHNNEPEFITKIVDVDPGSEYFVLRLDTGGSDINHIKACRIGVHAYADAIEPFIPQLAADLRERYPLL